MNESNWVKWSSIAEIISSIAILFTLVFLALQIRQNSIISQAQTRSAITEAINELVSANQSEIGLTVSIKNQNGEELSAAEQAWYTAQTRKLFRHWENVHYQYRIGLFSEQEMETYRRFWQPSACSSQMQAWWRDNKFQFDPDMVLEFDSIFADTSLCQALAAEGTGAQP